ncbi:MAG: bifunctional methionine sulfoxide reductase B/A protein [Candidatus Micrarchaeia archaeon]
MKKLTKKEENVIIGKGTESPFSGEYNDFFKVGVYVCRRCGALLYRSADKFKSDCGWPSFDDAIPGAVKRLRDADGARTEILCSTCGGHLGHVFEGEKLTSKNTRYCVNSLSMKFIPEGKMKFEQIVVGAGCFWCTEAVFSMVKGVISLTPGYAGGTTANPTYEQVCTGKTGHAEVLRITYNKKSVSIEKLLDSFFTMHDPTSLNKQGSDIGTQYHSIILYSTLQQKKAVDKFVNKIKGTYTQPIVTEVKKLTTFYPAEDYHKDYFHKNPHNPYCALVIAPKLNKVREKLRLFP